ncbi:family 1 glycosylhydrolase [Herbaspirillum sp. SJZ107]|uniref:family 1 glycosylhydrolase n=1 Tax=Herbaspirillum sp. SJZ107 TaxID=2572881 RepID=UPI00116D29C0|nr:family 1 glycosylhydrolase [Herbaspirillum sp. SJZ107]TQK06706.1 beta-glucosidase/6-phospho-beta-glucosidase/beta-galactosidase [Herbaspirillum sp. SJZ107]
MLFSSYFLGGFECTTGFNREGDWIDLIEETGHLRHADADYRRLCEVGIRAVRDGIRWPLVDKGRGGFDFSSVEPLVRAARRYKVDVVWDLFHFGYPAGLDLLSATFVSRFAEYCAACARYLRRRLQGTLWFTPVNEPSYFSWVAGEVGRFAPYITGRHHEFKVALARAAIAGIDAIRARVPDARFLNADPLCHVAPRNERPASLSEARVFNDDQVFESWDMLCGRTLPELGGSRAHLDVVGINYYWNSQWELGQEGEWLDDEDPRRVPLRDLIRSVHARYGGELIISETSHWGVHRARWLRELADEVDGLFDASVPLGGICIYPIIGMFDWHRPRPWMPMGLWDCDSKRGMRRLVHRPMLDALAFAQERFSRTGMALPPAQLAPRILV